MKSLFKRVSSSVLGAMVLMTTFSIYVGTNANAVGGNTKYLGSMTVNATVKSSYNDICDQKFYNDIINNYSSQTDFTVSTGPQLSAIAQVCNKGGKTLKTKLLIW